MRYLKQSKTVVILFALFYLLFSRTAYAYLDPGTGSYILQLFIAALLGGLFAVKIFWRKIKFFLIKLFSKRKNGKDDV